jgi:hypothetical protein
MVIGEDEDLGLAGEASKGTGVQDPVAVALETGPELIGFFRPCPVASTVSPSRAHGEEGVELGFALGEGSRDD